MKTMLDILIPVRNEEANLKALVTRIHQSLDQASISYSLIFIDDHSTDQSIRVLEKLQKIYPIQIYSKQGKRGKAYSILEGVQYATADYVAMIDADLQYPPEVIPQMYQKAKESGVVVARRKTSHRSQMRKILSHGFRLVFGKILLGMNCDVQSGLKLFKRDILLNIHKEDVSPWTLDVPLLHTALQLGFTISEVDIEFAKRVNGNSKINVLRSSVEIGGRAVHFRLKDKKPISIRPEDDDKMKGFGVIHKGKRFITHTSLDSRNSALHTFTFHQKLLFFVISITIILGMILNWLLAIKILVAILSFIYFVDVFFNLFLILRSLHSPPEISSTPEEIALLKDADLPIYTILCPLYKEAHILPHFIEAVEKIDWPKEKLDVMLLLEEDDRTTIEATESMQLPAYVRVIVVPDSQPKTKPKACNYGLHHALGEYLVIYDAEDIPDPQQLKKALLGFGKVPSTVRCLQAKLNYHNPHQNLLTRFFTAEYSLWFDVILTGLQSINTTIPLGGTSNHFRTKDLHDMKGWDPFNVTEDCDLGIRLFKHGFQTAIVDSITLEEANSSWRNWLRQRSRWIKGYMQTYLIHMRHPIQFFREQGVHAFLFQLTVGGKIAFMLINPFMWLLTISYFALYSTLGETIESFFPQIVFYMAVTSLLIGNFFFIYYYMIGVAKREHWGVMKFIFLVPIYWLMVSVAASIALYQLIVKPHYWEKTIHGLHLKKKKVEKQLEVTTGSVLPAITAQSIQRSYNDQSQTRLIGRLITRMKKQHLYIGGTMLVGMSMLANILNFLFNTYLGRTLSLETFGILSLMIGLFYIANIPFIALATTLNERVGFITGRFDSKRSLALWKSLQQSSWTWGIGLSILWIFSIPTLMSYFQVSSPVPFLLFTPIWLFGLLSSVDKGYLSGELKFGFVAVLIGLEALAKILFAIFVVEARLPQFIFLVLPFSVVLGFIPARYALKKRVKVARLPQLKFTFPKSFFVVSLLAGLSTMSFLSLDIILVKHVLSPSDAGLYALVSLIGKMIFFLGSLSTQFIIPLVSYAEGAKRDSSKTLWLSIIATGISAGFGVVLLGLAGEWTLPIIFGPRITTVIPLILWYSMGVLAFSISRVFITYYLAKKEYSFAIVSFLLTFVQIIGLEIFGATISHVVLVMTGVGMLNLSVLVCMHVLHQQVMGIENNVATFFDLLTRRFKNPPIQTDNLRILIFNWRDTRHAWAGGAETYIHQIAKQLVESGHAVTVFCGNDDQSPRNEKIDGVQMVRRGGFYTVYIWAFLYYVLRFRGKFDVVIDSENGIPFFTPLFVRVPKFLLIFHVHREVFLSHLRFPLSYIAYGIESYLMPRVYRNTPVFTISQSSRQAIEKLGFTQQSIRVIEPGIIFDFLKPSKKTKHPTFVYIGRLKPYKNVDIAIRAFSKIAPKYPTAQLHIAGLGESFEQLQLLVKQLHLTDAIEFHGKVTEEQKASLLSKSWVALQPSMIEGWGITVIEANASGTPVIASNVNGLCDSVVDGKTGLLVSPQNVSELAEAMDHLLINPKVRHRLSVQATEWAQRFTWENATTLMVNEIKTSVTTQEEILINQQKAYAYATEPEQQ